MNVLTKHMHNMYTQAILAEMSDEDLNELANTIGTLIVGARILIEDGQQKSDRNYWINHILKACKVFGNCERVEASTLKPDDIAVFSIIEVSPEIEKKETYSMEDILEATQSYDVFSRIISVKEIPIRENSPFLHPFGNEEVPTTELEFVIQPIEQILVAETQTDWNYEIVSVQTETKTNYLQPQRKVLKQRA